MSLIILLAFDTLGRDFTRVLHVSRVCCLSLELSDQWRGNGVGSVGRVQGPPNGWVPEFQAKNMAGKGEGELDVDICPRASELLATPLQSFINKSKRNGYCSPDLPDFNSLCASMKVDLFNKVFKIPTHVLHPLLPPHVSHRQRYGLRPRVHDRTLPERSSNLVDCNLNQNVIYERILIK